MFVQFPKSIITCASHNLHNLDELVLLPTWKCHDIPAPLLTLSHPVKTWKIPSNSVNSKVNLKWQQVKTAKQRFIFFSCTSVLYHCEVRCHCHVVCTSVNGQMNSWRLGSWFLVLDILIHNISVLTAQNCYPTRLHYDCKVFI